MIGQYRLFLLLCLSVGCSGPNALPVENSSPELVIRELPAQLVSELMAPSEPEPVVDCIVTVRNDAERPRDLVFEQTGCSCYGVAHAGRPLTRGDRISFAPGEDRDFVLGVKAPRQQARPDYRASFYWESDSAKVPLQMEARLTIYDDVRISPLTVTRGLLPAEVMQPFREEFEIVHTARDEQRVMQEPVFQASHSGVVVERVQAVGPHEAIEDSLWRREWKVFVQVTPPADLRPDSYPMNIRCSFPGTAGQEPFGTAQVILRLKTPLQFPESIYLGRIPAGMPRSRKVLVRSTDGEAFQLAVAEGSSADVDVQVDSTAATEHWVNLTVDPVGDGEFEHRVLLNSTHLRMPQIELHVTGTSFSPTAK